jgi:hypothetical protein
MRGMMQPKEMREMPSTAHSFYVVILLFVAGCQREPVPALDVRTEQPQIAAREKESSAARPLPLRAGKLPPLFVVDEKRETSDEKQGEPSSNGITVWRQDPKDRARIAEIIERELEANEKNKGQTVKEEPQSLFLEVSPEEREKLEHQFRQRIKDWKSASCNAWEDRGNVSELQERPLKTAAVAGLRKLMSSEIEVVNAIFLEKSEPLCYFAIGSVELELHHELLIYHTPDHQVICWHNEQVHSLCDLLLNDGEARFGTIERVLAMIGNGIEIPQKTESREINEFNPVFSIPSCVHLPINL